MKSRGLLTERDREVLLGEADDLQDLNKRQNEVRHNVRQRTKQLRKDVGILRDAGEADIVDDIVSSSTEISMDDIRDRVRRIETELEILQREHGKIGELKREISVIRDKLNSISE